MVRRAKLDLESTVKALSCPYQGRTSGQRTGLSEEWAEVQQGLLPRHSLQTPTWFPVVPSCTRVELCAGWWSSEPSVWAEAAFWARRSTHHQSPAWRAGLDSITSSAPSDFPYYSNGSCPVKARSLSEYLGCVFPSEVPSLFLFFCFFCFSACSSLPKPTSLTSPSHQPVTSPGQTMEAFIYSEKSRQFPSWCLAHEAIW